MTNLYGKHRKRTPLKPGRRFDRQTCEPPRYEFQKHPHPMRAQRSCETSSYAQRALPLSIRRQQEPRPPWFHPPAQALPLMCLPHQREEGSFADDQVGAWVSLPQGPQKPIEPQPWQPWQAPGLKPTRQPQRPRAFCEDAQGRAWALLPQVPRQRQSSPSAGDQGRASRGKRRSFLQQPSSELRKIQLLGSPPLRYRS